MSRFRNFCVILALTLTSVTSYVEKCGKPMSAQQLIFGGTAVIQGEWPWVVSLFYKATNDFFCTSTLISNQHLLTAAHCVREKSSLGSLSPQDIFAYIGRYDITLSVDEPKSIRSDISRAIIHPDWNPEDERFDADLAILVLSSPITFNDIIQPICLPTPDYNPFKVTGTVVGYGHSESDKLHETFPRQIKIPSVTNEDCFFSDYTLAKIASPRSFCAGEKGKTPCQGDSGAGFFINNGPSFFIAGLVSSSLIQKCGLNELVVFTNVAKFADWISQQIKTTEDSNTFESVFNHFDEANAFDESVDDSNIVNAACTFKVDGTTYGCYVNNLEAPDSEITLNVNQGTNLPGRTSTDVVVMHVKDGKVTHFPGMTKIVQTFPNLNGFGITFTKLKHIQRSELKGLEPLKFFLISDNLIEYIPPDTFLDLTNLELIDICRNNVTNIDAKWLSTMTKLKTFKARSNKFEYLPTDMFKNNPLLEEILLDGNQISIIYTYFWNLQNIKTVSILRNPCINMMYCKSTTDSTCIKSIVQFSYYILANCQKFN